MCITAIGHEGRTEELSILRLLEDIWIYSNKNTELQLEIVIRPKGGCSIKKIFIFMPYHILEVADLSSLYLEPRFTQGYVECWRDIYKSGIEIISEEERQIRIGDIQATVGKVEQAEILYNSKKASEIRLKFDPPITTQDGNKATILRLGIIFEGLIRNRAFLQGGKSMTLFTYGILPITGAELGGLLEEHNFGIAHLFKVSDYTIHVKLSKSPEIIANSLPAVRRFLYGHCEIPQRYCPPLERIALNLRTTVDKLKKLKSYYMAWEFENVHPSEGMVITVEYFRNWIQKWIYNNWLAILAIILSIMAIMLAL